MDGQPIPRDAADKPALHGTLDAYTKFAYSLDAYAGKKIDLRFRYQTDGGVARRASRPTPSRSRTARRFFTDNAETADAAWAATGFPASARPSPRTTRSTTSPRTGSTVSYDKTLKTGPYNFGFTERPNWVEHYAYQNGLLIWKWDTSQADNNTSQHPGTGLVLPIDSHPTAMKWKDRQRCCATASMSYDSPFSLYRTDAVTLHQLRTWRSTSRASKGVSRFFNDRKSDYYDESSNFDRWRQDHRDTNTKIKILKEAKNGSTIELEVGPAGR